MLVNSRRHGPVKCNWRQSVACDGLGRTTTKDGGDSCWFVAKEKWFFNLPDNFTQLDFEKTESLSPKRYSTYCIFFRNIVNKVKLLISCIIIYAN
jgi:hypothetical protein